MESEQLSHDDQLVWEYANADLIMAGVPVNGTEDLTAQGFVRNDETLIDACRRYTPPPSVMRLSCAEAKGKIFDAYPFPVRRGYGYTAWLAAVKEWWDAREKLRLWESRDADS